MSSVPTDTTRRRPRPPEDGPARRPEGGFTLRGGSAARTAELRGGGGVSRGAPPPRGRREPIQKGGGGGKKHLRPLPAAIPENHVSPLVSAAAGAAGTSLPCAPLPGNTFRAGGGGWRGGGCGVCGGVFPHRALNAHLLPRVRSARRAPPGNSARRQHVAVAGTGSPARPRRGATLRSGVRRRRRHLGRGSARVEGRGGGGE